MSGKDSGIYAVTQITSDPQLMEEYPEEKKYWLGDEKGAVKQLRVSMSVAEPARHKLPGQQSRMENYFGTD